MRMTVIFTLFAILAGVTAICLPYKGRGLCLDLMLAYLAFAVLSALLGLMRSRSAR